METKEKRYVADVIGEEYLNWKPLDMIMIKAPTGSGKTYFCLHKLLLRAIQNGERILYLINRKVLKSQLEKEKERVSDDLMREGQCVNIDNYIQFMTYQSLEIELTDMMANKGIIQYKLNWYRQHYSIVVYDECHYFYSDSNFNTNTELSYDFLSHCFNMRIQIFMSATMDKMEMLVKQHRPSCRWEDEPIISGEIAFKVQMGRRNYVSYNCDKDYRYIKPKILRSREAITEVINEVAHKDEKWLVFVDNKEFGKSIAEELVEKKEEATKEKTLSADDVVYIDADYELDTNARKTVEHITQRNSAKEKVVITTAVMDCGVSFHDIDLRNIIILADTEESFIQMLGRKRKDVKGEQNINLYICRLNKEYFRRRLQSVQRKISSYHVYRETINKLYEVRTQNGQMEYWGPFAFYRAGYSPQPYMQNPAMTSLLQNESFRKNMQGIIYFYQGIAANNKFAVRRLLDLEKYYEDMVAELENDDFAYIKKIYEWLGFSEEEIQADIVKNKEELKVDCIKRIEIVLGEYLERELSSQENQEMKSKFTEDVKYLLENEVSFSNAEKDNILKTGRNISEEQFNKLMEVFQIPYRMGKPSRSKFLILKKEDEK